MTVALNGYTLNAVNEAANWSAVEYALLTAIVGKLPDAGATVTASSRHSHSLLVSSDGAVDPALYTDATGNLYTGRHLTVYDGYRCYFGARGSIYANNIANNLLIYAVSDMILYSLGAMTAQVGGGDLYISVDSFYGVGIVAPDPNARLEINDNNSVFARILKITQDNEDVYGVVVGNDTASTNDSIGLTLKAFNDGSAELGNTGSSTLYIDCVSGNIELQIGNTTVATVAATGISFSNNATIHIIAQNGAPTSTANGALWLDTDAGGANGTLKIYSNGDWRTVQDLN